jgi:hypothetical protein
VIGRVQLFEREINSLASSRSAELAQQQQVSTLRKSLQQLAPATKVSFARLRRALQGRR